MPPDEPTDEERLEQLPEDYDTPFQPADNGGDPTHPETDTSVDTTELYQEGIDGGGRQTTAPDNSDVTAYHHDNESDDTAETTL